MRAGSVGTVFRTFSAWSASVEVPVRAHADETHFGRCVVLVCRRTGAGGCAVTIPTAAGYQFPAAV